MFSLLGLVRDVVEDLVGHDGGDRATDLVVAGYVGTTLALGKKENAWLTGTIDFCVKAF